MLLAAAAMCACSGSGSGSAGILGNRTSMSVSTRELDVSGALGGAAPTATVTITVTNPPTDLYVGTQNTSNGISSVNLSPQDQVTENLVVLFKTPAVLGVGTYHDTLQVAVCYDAACKTQVTSSPQTVAITYTVTPGTGGGTGGVSLIGISPTSAVAGSGAFTLTVNGAGFTPSSHVVWNGTWQPTTYVSATQLSASISAANVAVPGGATVTVFDASGGTSNGLPFTIGPPVFTLSAISPSFVPAGASDFVLTVRGNGFVAASLVRWNGTALPTTFKSQNELWATVPAADVASQGTATVDVENPSTLSGGAMLTVGAASKDAVSFQITPSHGGVITFDAVSFTTTSTWTATLDGNPSYPLIAAGKVFVTVPLSGGSELVALSQTDGSIVWGPIALSNSSNAAYDNGTVFTISAGVGTPAMVRAFDAGTGTQRWSTLLSSQYMFSSGITAANGMVYTGGAGSGGTIYALDASNGAVTWTQGVANGDSSIPAVTLDGLYVTYPCQTYDLRPASGTSVWSNNTGCDGGGGGTPVVANGVLYAPNGMGGSYSGMTFDPETGAVLGTYAADNVPAIGPTMGYFLQGGTLRGIAMASNTIKWSFAGDGHLVTSPIGVNQYVVIGSSSGNVYALDGSTGAQVWTVNVGASLPAGAGWGARMPYSGLAAGDGLLVIPAGSTLTAFTLSTNP